MPTRVDPILPPPNAAPRSRSRVRSEDGFTLIEVLIAAVVLVLGTTALFGLLDTSMAAISATRAREGATSVARSIVEDARTIPYAQISPGAIEGQLQSMTGLSDASPAAGWQIIRNGVTYTVTSTECSIDDPKDGFGVHDSSFCAESSTEGSEDSQPADLKRITVDVRWTAQGRSPDVHQVGVLTAAGASVGLSATGLKLSSPIVSAPTAPVITLEPPGNELRFTVTAPSGTTAMRWALDGVKQTVAPTLESGTTWTFSWSIAGLSDGSYQVAAQAVNASGVVGPPVSIAVTLIRNTPAAPKGIVGGFNTVFAEGVAKPVVELQWQPNAERNVIGYRVYRPGKELACPTSSATLSLATSCIDFSPPPTNATNLTYEVVALYRKAEGQALSTAVSEGPAGLFTVTGGSPPPAGPNTPGAPLTLEHLSGGAVKLTWSAPKGGTSVAFYRIYRGSTDYTSRYDITANGSTTTYTDTNATVTHSYWVTAVSTNLTESAFLGPVSG